MWDDPVVRTHLQMCFAGEGGGWWLYAADSYPRAPPEMNLGVEERLPDRHSPPRARAWYMSAQHGRIMFELTGAATIDDDTFYETAGQVQILLIQNGLSTWPSHHSYVAFVGGPTGDPARHKPCSRLP